MKKVPKVKRTSMMEVVPSANTLGYINTSIDLHAKPLLIFSPPVDPLSSWRPIDCLGGQLIVAIRKLFVFFLYHYFRLSF